MSEYRNDFEEPVITSTCDLDLECVLVDCHTLELRSLTDGILFGLVHCSIGELICQGWRGAYQNLSGLGFQGGFWVQSSNWSLSCTLSRLSRVGEEPT